jgi:hypothetical protein
MRFSFLLSPNPQNTNWLWAPPGIPAEGYRTLLSWMKGYERGADHPPPFDAQLKNGTAIPPLPRTSSGIDA